MDQEEKLKQEDPVVIKSLPVKSYLEHSVVPVLLEGLTELSKVRPENPVEWLGEYLLDAAKTGK